MKSDNYDGNWELEYSAVTAMIYHENDDRGGKKIWLFRMQAFKV